MSKVKDDGGTASGFSTPGRHPSFPIHRSDSPVTGFRTNSNASVRPDGKPAFTSALETQEIMLFTVLTLLRSLALDSAKVSREKLCLLFPVVISYVLSFQ